MEAAVVAYLRDHALLQPVLRGRIYPLRLPQNPTFPAVTYQRVSTTAQTAHDGPVSLLTTRLQLDVWGERYADVKYVAELLHLALLGWSGIIGTSKIWITGQLGEVDLQDPDTQLYRVSMDFAIHHKKTEG